MIPELAAAAYARMMKALLPPGKKWNLQPDSTLTAVFLACGDELARISQRSADLIEESDPRTTSELLAEWERMLGLGADGTEDDRRARVVSLVIRRQRFRPVDFQAALAPLLGQDEGDVVVIERGRAFAVAVGDDREIYRFFIYRDPAEPGGYDLEAAQSLVDRMSPARSRGHVIESIAFKCDDPFSLCDRDLLGV